MKHSSREICKHVLLVVHSLAVVFAFGCKDHSTLADTSATERPVLTSIEPDSGAFNTIVRITGKHFSSINENNLVYFNGKNAKVLQASSNELIVLVPTKAGSGTIKVSVNGNVVSGLYFNYALTISVEPWAGKIKGLKNDVGDNARFNQPWGIEINSLGEVIIGDGENALIRKIDRNRNVTTLAGSSIFGYKDGPASKALFSKPMGLARGPDGLLYIADSFNHVIRRIDPGRNVTTFAGNSDDARLFAPSDVTISSDYRIYVTDTYNFKVRMINTAGDVSTVAGSGLRGDQDGAGIAAQFQLPLSLALNPTEDTLYIADYHAHRIKRIDINSGQVTTLAGTGTPGFVDGSLAEAQLNNPAGIEIGTDGTIYFSDSGNHAIRMIQNNRVITLAGGPDAGHINGNQSESRFNRPYHLILSPNETFLYINDWGNHVVRRVRIE